MPLTEALKNQVDALAWYHAIDLGEYQTPGRFSPPLPPNVTLFGVMDILQDIPVSGMRCMDVGPAHGLISFGLALKGADVVAINIGSPTKGPHFAVLEQIFDVSILYQAPCSVADAPQQFTPASFDLIVCAGVMYHLINPAEVFFRLRPLLKRGGILVMETVYYPESDQPVLVLNSVNGTFAQPTTYFLASQTALEGLARPRVLRHHRNTGVLSEPVRPRWACRPPRSGERSLTDDSAHARVRLRGSDVRRQGARRRARVDDPLHGQGWPRAARRHDVRARTFRRIRRSTARCWAGASAARPALSSARMSSAQSRAHSAGSSDHCGRAYSPTANGSAGCTSTLSGHGWRRSPRCSTTCSSGSVGSKRKSAVVARSRPIDVPAGRRRQPARRVGRRGRPRRRPR